MNRLLARELGLVIALALLVGCCTWMEPAFIGGRNLSNLSIEFSIRAILALGVFLVLIPGHTDLSTGSGVGLLGAIATVLLSHHLWPAPLCLLAALATALVLWTGMGYLVVRQRIPAFIATLGGMLLYRGLQWQLTGSASIPTTIGGQPNALSSLTSSYLPAGVGIALAVAVGLARGALAGRDRQRRAAAGLPLEDRDLAFVRCLVVGQGLVLVVLLLNRFHGVPASMLLLALVASGVLVLTSATPFGRHLYAIGGNREAAFLSGIRVDRTVIIAFAACGLLVGLTGCLQTAYCGNSTSDVGSLMELDAISACVIGGVSLAGGVGTVSGVLLGTLLMAALINGMTLHNLPPWQQYEVRGVVLMVAAWLDLALSRR